jgi:hypothetical protein
LKDADLQTYEAAVRGHICQACKLTPTAGEYCAAHMTRTCPLSRYLGDIVQVLSRIPHHHEPAKVASGK